MGLNYCTRFLVDGARGEAGRAVTPAQIMTHIEHWLDLDGEDVVALGGDLDGASVPDCLSDAAAMPAFQQALLANFGETLTRKLWLRQTPSPSSSAWSCPPMWRGSASSPVACKNGRPARASCPQTHANSEKPVRAEGLTS